MKRRNWLAVLILGPFFLFDSICYALEPDQFRHWSSVELQDSLPLVDNRLAFLIDNYLEKTNRQTSSKISCEAVAQGFLHYVRPHFFKNRLVDWMIKQPLVDMYPAKKSPIRDIRESIYRGPVWPFLMPIAQSVKINGVYLGNDKLSHFFSSGKRYTKRYWKARRQGQNHDQAIEAAIQFGLGRAEEAGVLGYWSSGVFSYADLEANYQGMMLALDLCDGDNPVLQNIAEKNNSGAPNDSFNKRDSSKKAWVRTRKISFAKYVNPLWDEAYNNSAYIEPRRRRVAKIIQEKHCAWVARPDVVKRWQNYRKRTPSHAQTRFLGHLILQNAIPDPKVGSLAVLCQLPPGQLDSPAYTRETSR